MESDVTTFYSTEDSLVALSANLEVQQAAEGLSGLYKDTTRLFKNRVKSLKC